MHSAGVYSFLLPGTSWIAYYGACMGRGGKGGTYETPLKRPAHHLHEKATPAGLAESSGIQGFS